MTREFPMISEFRRDSPRCPKGWNGCAVAATEAILRRYRPWDTLPDQKDLGASMGRRHRQQDRRSTHGICPQAWCPYCSYLELKARHVAVAYGRLSVDHLRAHLARGHAVHLGGWYEAIHLVEPRTYDRRTPARGRSDNTALGRYLHSLVVWEVGERAPGGRPRTYIVSDPDFGSPARPRVPPYCEYDAQEIEQMYVKGGLRIAYCLEPPPPLGARRADAEGIVLRFGARPHPSGPYVVLVDHARQRTAPFIRLGNIIREVPQDTEFRVAQTTRAGTNVAGSSTWHGDATGRVWMHHSLLRPAV